MRLCGFCYVELYEDWEAWKCHPYFHCQVGPHVSSSSLLSAECCKNLLALLGSFGRDWPYRLKMYDPRYSFYTFEQIQVSVPHKCNT